MAVSDAHVFPGFLTSVLTQHFFPKPPTTFLTCLCRGERENVPERKFASTGDQTHIHQVMSPTLSLLSHQGGPSRIDGYSSQICFGNGRKDCGERRNVQHVLLLPQSFPQYS